MPSRESELYKDKIEVSLDGRQIFYLFFGGAVIVGLVFVLGVMVGRRVEARGHLDRAQTQIASDPLAALDRLERSDNLSFHGALTGTEAPTDVDRAIGELEKHRAAGDPHPAGLDAKPGVRPEIKPDVKPEAKPDVRPEVVSHPDADRPRSDKHDGDKHDGDKHAKKHDDKSDKPVTRPDARAERSDDHPDPRPDARPDPRPDARPDRPDAKADKADARSDRTEAKAEKADKSDAKSEKADKTEAKAEKADKSDAKSKSDVRGKFTLQLSSFQDKTEAEAFLSSMKSAGFQPYLTEAEVSGKGTFYRVRLGSYRSLDAASDAKAEYEKSAKKTAQVMRL
ncbi:MAG TPA: SPOR domain-containing protein [Kofleriaceae bacterium]|jgi:cell division septation protein DedD|nr:SPOR domain-containing protein [Kofleriaceae bacterium]